jgi:hypothetical protein
MAYSLSFLSRAEYDQFESGITIKVTLRSGESESTTSAKIDMGAQVCLFQREIGESLGLNIESGHRRRMETLAGSLTAYGHSVSLYTLGLEFDSVVYFAAAYDLPRNPLGREGWLQKVRLAVVDYAAALYLSPYAYV